MLLARDRCRDELWRQLIRAREHAGDLALAVHARRDYQRLPGSLAPDAASARAMRQLR